MNETLKLLLCLLLAGAVAGCSPRSEEPPLKGASIGGPFTLTDQDGRTVTERDFAGRYRLMYFGFTHCPDVCPTDLAVIGQALRRFEAKDPKRAARVAPIFITVDPERDTPAVLKDYVAAFHPRLIGLTGTPKQIADVAHRYGAYYGKEDEPRPGGSYDVNHSRLVELIGPDGEPIALLPYEKGADRLAGELEWWVK